MTTTEPRSTRTAMRPLSIASAVAAILTSAAGAQTPPVGSGGPQLEEIFVTAQKRQENLQNVPVSIQALDASKLQDLQVQSFDDYLKFLPSLSSQNYGPGQSQLYVRGVTNGGDGLHVGSQPLVGVYLDEQPVTTIANNLDVHIYDVARVEALSGPQGTLFGSSSMAGTLRIITNQPDPTGFKAGYTLTGNSITKGGAGGTAEGYLNLPLGEHAAVRLVGFAEHDGGYINNIAAPPMVYPTSGAPRDNAALAKSHYNEVDTYGARAALKIDLDDSWTVTPAAMTQQQQAAGQFGFVPALGDLNVARYAAERNDDRWWLAALTVQGKIANFDFVYSGGYIHRNVDNVNDYSDYSFFYDTYYTNNYTANPTYYGDNFRNDAGDLISPAQTTVSRNQYTKQSHEIRLTSPKEWRLRGVAGLFYQQQTNITRDEYQVQGLAAQYSITGQPGVFYLNAQDRVDKDMAAYTELSYDLTPKLTATAGLRLFRYRNSVYGFFGYNGHLGYNDYFASASGENLCVGPADPGNPVRPCINIDSVTTRSGETYKYNLSYKLRDDKLIYGTLSTGFRPGGVNRVRNRPAYTPDYLTNLELGWKTAWHEGAVRFNGAAFLERWKDAQFGFTGANGITEITNAGKAEIRGLEADLQWAVSRNFMLSGSLTVLRSKLLQNACHYPSPSFNCSEASLDGKIDTTPLAVAGSRLPVSPRMKANLIGRYHFPFRSTEAHVQGALVAQSDVIPGLETAANVATGNQPGYVTFDLAAGIERGSWSAELYIDNFFDRRAEQSRYTPCNPSYCSQVYVIPVRPRLAGLTFSQKF